MYNKSISETINQAADSLRTADEAVSDGVLRDWVPWEIQSPEQSTPQSPEQSTPQSPEQSTPQGTATIEEEETPPTPPASFDEAPPTEGEIRREMKARLWLLLKIGEQMGAQIPAVNTAHDKLRRAVQTESTSMVPDRRDSDGKYLWTKEQRNFIYAIAELIQNSGDLKLLPVRAPSQRTDFIITKLKAGTLTSEDIDGLAEEFNTTQAAFRTHLMNGPRSMANQVTAVLKGPQPFEREANQNVINRMRKGLVNAEGFYLQAENNIRVWNQRVQTEISGLRASFNKLPQQEEIDSII